MIDATPSSSTYGKVVNTATVGPLVENEPHHMQYLYHKGDKIFAGGLFSSATYVFDVSKLPTVSLSGVSLPTDTRGGSIPDAFWTLPDHTAYATYMGGPVVPGPYTYSDGETRIGWIHNLAVAAEVRGGGLGRRLIEHALHHFRAAGMTVERGTSPRLQPLRDR